MNAIERLRDALARRFPGLALSIDIPADPSGHWFLDVRRDDDGGGTNPVVVVEWRPGWGFGISRLDPDGADFGLGPDEVVEDEGEALGRVVEMVGEEG